MTECDLCGGITHDATLTGDSHPRGVNHVVCASCSQETLTVTDDGLELPDYLRAFTRQIVFKTPRSTIQHFGTNAIDGPYPMIQPDDFGPTDDPRHPELVPDKVSIKREGEPADRFFVDTGGDADV